MKYILYIDIYYNTDTSLFIYILILTRGLREFTKGNIQFIYNNVPRAHSYKLKLTNLCYKKLWYYHVYYLEYTR